MGIVVGVGDLRGSWDDGMGDVQLFFFLQISFSRSTSSLISIRL